MTMPSHVLFWRLGGRYCGRRAAAEHAHGQRGQQQHRVARKGYRPADQRKNKGRHWVLAAVIAHDDNEKPAEAAAKGNAGRACAP